MKRLIRFSPAGGSDSIESFEIYRLSLSTRARNLLKNLSLLKLSDLKTFGLDRLKQEEGCGRKTYLEILAEVKKLEEIGAEKYIAASRAGGELGDRPGVIMDTGTAIQLLQNELGKAGFINSTQAQKLLGMSTVEVRNLLNLLVEKGFAVREGRRRGMRYVRKM